ncbi:MAG: DUF1731 domain-containing protein, partial [Bdellovibrionales bacterium]|nr:DUF1731 domain-containing protein [Bdellovibrionales bacterium]
QNLLEGIRQHQTNLRVFVGATAIGYYGYSESMVFTEDSPAGEGFVSELCVKWENEEQKIRQFVHDVKLAQIRIGVVFGKGGGFLKEVVPVFQKNLGAPLGSGEQKLSWIDLEDLVEILALSLENPKFHGVINAVAPEAKSNRQWSKLLANELKVSLLPAAPASALKLAFGEMSELLLKGSEVKPLRLEGLGFQWKHPSIESSFQKVLGKPALGEVELVFEQWVPHKREGVFPFFESESNLEVITPPWLKFKVLKKSTEQIQKGTLIDYELRLRGLPLHWRTEITDWKQNERFVDEQVRGPYDKWHHVHEFETLGVGTLLRDRVTYKVPIGVLGRWVAGPFVKNDVEKIFSYRQKVIYQKFGAPQGD